jgi:3-hydroxyisobutyrate dehydrogenase-like beta-hydroxyacid dehydrogenase
MRARARSFDELKDVLSVIGKPFYIGDKPGMGQTMKLCNNLLSPPTWRSRPR